MKSWARNRKGKVMSYSVVNKKNEVLYEGKDVPKRLEGEGKIIFKCDVPMYGNTDLGSRVFTCEDNKGSIIATKNNLSDLPKYTYIYEVSGTNLSIIEDIISRIEQFIKTKIANEEAELYELGKSPIINIIQKIRSIKFPLRERRSPFCGIVH